MIKAAATYGLGIVLSLLMAGFMGWVIRFILKENAKREERLAGIIERDLVAQKNALEQHDRRMSEAAQRTEEANKRQREEHEQLSGKQKQLLDNQDSFSHRQDATVQVLERIAGVLAALNPNANTSQLKLSIQKEKEQ